MNKEDYVSFECAKLLKEKGFREPCYYNYDKKGYHVQYLQDIDWNGNFPQYYSRPTLYEVQKWLREKQNLFIEITYMHGNYYMYSILTIPTHDYVGVNCARINSDNYEQCFYAGILEALKLI